MGADPLTDGKHWFVQDDTVLAIVATNMTPQDWARVLDHLRTRAGIWALTSDTAPGGDADHHLASGELHGHLDLFYYDDELVIAFQPMITDASQAAEVLNVMTELGELLEREVVMTPLEAHENGDELVIYRYRHGVLDGPAFDGG